MSKLDQLTKELHELERKLVKADRDLKQLLKEKVRIEADIAKEKARTR